jgi:hypothetical protein
MLFFHMSVSFIFSPARALTTIIVEQTFPFTGKAVFHHPLSGWLSISGFRPQLAKAIKQKAPKKVLLVEGSGPVPNHFLP